MYLLDTNAIIYYLNNSLSEKSNNKISEILKSSFNISIITKMELLGFKDHTETSFKKTKDFIEHANIYYIDDILVDKVIEIKRKYSIKLPDAIIGATVLLNKFTLISTNVDDFKKINIKIYTPIFLNS